LHNTSSTATTTSQPFVVPEVFHQQIRDDSQEIIEKEMDAVYFPVVQALITNTRVGISQNMRNAANKFLTANVRRCAWIPKRNIGITYCPRPALQNSKYCDKPSHKRCELEDREREETRKRKHIEKAYERDTGRKPPIEVDSDDDNERPPKRARTGPQITSAHSSPKVSTRSATKTTQPTNVLSQPQQYPSNEVLQLREQVLQMQQMMQQFLQAQHQQSQKQQPQPRDPLIDGLNKQLGATTINSPARQDNTDEDGEVDVGSDDNPPKQTGEKNSG
jgi:hypothetical protein